DLSTNAVDGLVASDIDQPRPGISWQLLRRPAFQRRGEGLLQHILGKIEIADETDQRSERAASLVTEDFVDLGRGHMANVSRRPKDEPGTSRFRVDRSRDAWNEGFAFSYKPRSAALR